MKPVSQAVCAAALWLVLSQPANAALPPPVPAAMPADAVRVEIFEGLSDQTSWNFLDSLPAVTETYTEPVFGFAAMSTKYSPRGVKLDRGLPFLLRASVRVTLPPGELRLLLRARTGSRLWIDDTLVLSTRFPNLNADGHEEVPDVPAAVAPDIRYLQPGQLENLTNFITDGRPHTFVLEALVGTKGRRPELGELSVSFSTGDGESFRLLSPKRKVWLTEAGWTAYASERIAFCKTEDKQRRQLDSADEARYWTRRHELARAQLSTLNTNSSQLSSIDSFIDAKLRSASVQPAPLTDDYAFLRRVSLDVLGVIPSPEQLDAFVRDKSKDRRARAVDRLLAEPSWADHWVGYWQDVLAENPGILKPMLNNTGPFRWWLHDSFAAMLRREPQLVPLSSSIPTNANIVIGKKVKVTLKPGSKVEPRWPFPQLASEDLPTGVLRNENDPREKLAALVTDPRNERFARVLVNRVWKRYLGWGLVEPVDDWSAEFPLGSNEHAGTNAPSRSSALQNPDRASHPELLDFLARELVAHDYDLKHVARLILNSQTYQRATRPDGALDQPAAGRLFASPARRRLSAEQLVDSLFAAVGKPFRSEELNMDVDGRRPVKDFNNLGTPARAWEFASLSNERDRPALSMPKAQAIVDTLCAFGWRESRQNPLTVRDQSPNVLQPAALANGLVANGRIARLSDDSAITALALQDRPLPELVRALFLRVLSRPPTVDEMNAFTAQLADGYADRRLNPSGSAAHKSGPARPVSWSNHLNPEATRIKQEQERAARAGDPP